MRYRSLSKNISFSISRPKSILSLWYVHIPSNTASITPNATLILSKSIFNLSHPFFNGIPTTSNGIYASNGIPITPNIVSVICNWVYITANRVLSLRWPFPKVHIPFQIVEIYTIFHVKHPDKINKKILPAEHAPVRYAIGSHSTDVLSPQPPTGVPRSPKPSQLRFIRDQALHGTSNIWQNIYLLAALK